MPVIPYCGESPKIASTAFVAPDAWVTGRVELGENSSIFFHSVLRGDIQRIIIGACSNIQDLSMVHTSRGLKDCVIGDYVTVGHQATLHGCQIQNNCLIGMGAVVLDNVEIGENSIIGAQSLVPMNMKIPPNSMVMGVPAKIKRTLTDQEILSIRQNAEHYVKVAREYKQYFIKATQTELIRS